MTSVRTRESRTVFASSFCRDRLFIISDRLGNSKLGEILIPGNPSDVGQRVTIDRSPIARVFN